jgi:hypothetical protein
VKGPVPVRYLTVIPSDERRIHPESSRTETFGGVQSRFRTTAVGESANAREGEYSSRTSVGESNLILAFPERIPPGTVS